MKGGFTFSSGRASSALFLSWLLFMLVASSSYEGNLRANLMAITYEKPVDSDQDLWDAGWPLYMAKQVNEQID